MCNAEVTAQAQLHRAYGLTVEVGCHSSTAASGKKSRWRAAVQRTTRCEQMAATDELKGLRDVQAGVRWVGPSCPQTDEIRTTPDTPRHTITFLTSSSEKSASEFCGHNKMQPTSVSTGSSVFTVQNLTPAGTWTRPRSANHFGGAGGDAQTLRLESRLARIGGSDATKMGHIGACI